MILFGIASQLLTWLRLPVKIDKVASTGICTVKFACAFVCGNGDVAQLGERCLRKAEAEGSTPFISTIFFFIKYLLLPVQT